MSATISVLAGTAKRVGGGSPSAGSSRSPLWRGGDITALGWRVSLIGLLGGAANGLGSWALFEALERGAKASVAVPLTALYPLVTIVLARIFLAETLTFRQWVGIALAIAGGAMLSYESEERRDS